MPTFVLAEIASRINGEVIGDPSILITGVATLRDAGEGEISFLSNPKYYHQFKKTAASAVIVPLSVKNSSTNLVVVDNPYQSLLQVTNLFHPQKEERFSGIHPTAIIGVNVKLGEDVSIGSHVCIGDNTEIADGVTIGAGSFIGRDSKVGSNSRIYPTVTILDRVKIGRNCIIHSGVVLGSDGYGFVKDEKGKHRKIPQVGDLIVGDDVEIGANCAIDRGSIRSTVIGNGVKIDNLVHVAHNVEIGDNSLIIAQVGISGSARIGREVTLAGQAGLVGHVQVGDGAIIGAQAGVTKSVKKNEVVSGYPARPHMVALKTSALLSRLPKFYDSIKEIKKRLSNLERKLGR